VCVAVELAEQSLAVFLGGIGQLLNKILDLFAAGVLEALGTAEVDGIGFDKFGIELVLANDLAEPITQSVARTVAVCAFAVGQKLREKGRLYRGVSPGSNLLN